MEKGDALLDRGYYKPEFNRNGNQLEYIKKSNVTAITVSKVFVPKHSRSCASCWMMIYENCFSFWVDF